MEPKSLDSWGNSLGKFRAPPRYSCHLHPVPFLSKSRNSQSYEHSKLASVQNALGVTRWLNLCNLSLHKNDEPIMGAFQLLSVAMASIECAGCLLPLAFPFFYTSVYSSSLPASHKGRWRNTIRKDSWGPHRNIELPQSTRAHEQFTSPLEIPLNSLPH